MVNKDPQQPDATARRSDDATGQVPVAKTITKDKDITTRKRAEDLLNSLSQEVSQGASTVYRDLIVIFTLAIIVFLLAAYLKLFDAPINFFLNFTDKAGLHDLFATSLFLVLAFVVFSYRRWKALAAQKVARRKEEEALRALHDELELRVLERTADLILVNEALRSEIGERQLIEESLRESERRYKQMFERNGAVQWLLDPTTLSIVEANQAASDFYGYSLEEIKGMNITAINTFLGEEKARELLGRMSREAMTVVSTHRLASGEIRDVEGYTVPIDIGGSRLIHAIISDVTERKQAEKARMAQEAAEQANRAKSAFLSRMSHELRTPLNAILGFGQLLEMEDGTPEQKESVDYILKAGQHLLGLINEVLDIARIEEGQLTILVEPVFVCDVLKESMDLMQTLAAHRKIKMKADLAGPDNCYAMADQQRLQQVLLNLLANAIKYNREGGEVNVSCSELSDEADEQDFASASTSRLRIEVSDTGPGLSPDKVARLFTPFERLGAERGDVEGTGLGLALSKHLIEAMGGSIGVESEPGRGSTFWVELFQTDGQLAQIDRRASGLLPPIEEPDDARTILYIEDNLSNLRLVERILGQRKDFKLITAMQGQMGLDMALTHQPDLILLDLHLPDITGTGVLRRLQEDPRTGLIPVVMLSADANLQQVDTLLAAGAQAYLTKPLNVKQLLKVLEETPVRVTV